MKKRRIIKVEVPKEIWDADMSICRIFSRDSLVKVWMESIDKTIKLCQKR